MCAESSARVDVLNVQSVRDQTGQPALGFGVVGSRRAVPEQGAERVADTGCHPGPVTADVDARPGPEQRPQFVGLGGHPVLDEGVARLGCLAEDRAQGDGARGLGGVQFVGVQEVTAWVVAAEVAQGGCERGLAAASRAPRSAMAPRNGARPVPAAIMTTGVCESFGTRKTSRHG